MAKELSELLYWVYHQEDGLNTKLSVLDRLCSGYDKTLRMMVFTSEEMSFKQALEERNPSEYDLEEIYSNDRVTSYKIKREIRSTGNIYTGKFLVVNSKYENTYTVVTHENREVFRRGIKRYLEQFYPLISRPFIPSNQIKSIWDEIDNEEETEVRTVKLVAYENQISTNEEERQEANVKYTDEPYLDSYKKVIADDMYIDKWEVVSKGRRDTAFKGFLSRRSLLKCSSNFSNFYSEVINRVESHSSHQNENFKDRDRSDGNSRPLEIQYERDVFKDTSMNKKLIDSLNNTRNVSCSVYHGNPYLYMTVTDFLDGSSFDIVVHSDNSIEIIPQMRGNPASISRIVNQIFEKFGEGDLQEVQTDERHERRAS